MILIFGGTTEGRIAAETCDTAGKPFYYSTKGETQEINMINGLRLTGAMTSSEIATFCVANDIRCVIDAAHPFAENLHRSLAEAERTCLELNHKITVIRMMRSFAKTDVRAIRCDTYSDAVKKMEDSGVKRLLALTGVNTLEKLKPFWSRHVTFFRILNRKESIDIAKNLCFPSENIIFFNDDVTLPTTEDESELMRRLNVDAIITKESGDSGGFRAKVEAAAQSGIMTFIIRRPSPPDSFVQVTGRHTLRRAIEHYLPDFFPLRTGLTTGACATAATKAALQALLSSDTSESVSFALPDGETLTIPILSTTTGPSYAESAVKKESGDDPDITNGCIIHSRVSRGAHGIRFLQGPGVGTVTLPGLGIEVGEPAINTTPRKMITEAIRELSDEDFDITISVENGENLAKHTFNPRVGVIGGISIIGTSGIIHPLSNDAFKDSIKREIEVAKAIGCEEIAFTSGKKSEDILRESKDIRCIHHGNFIGETLKYAFDLGFRDVTLAIMIGKAVKLAEGHLDTHSHKVTMNKSFMKELALSHGCSQAVCDVIDDITLARELWSRLEKDDLRLFIEAITQECQRHCETVFPEGNLTVVVIKEK